MAFGGAQRYTQRGSETGGAIKDQLLGLGLMCLIFVPIERILPAHREQKVLRTGLFTDGLHYFFSGMIIGFGAVFIAIGAHYAGQALLPQAFLDAVAGQPIWLAYLEALVIADLGFYWSHRLFHAVPFLWKFHQVHHSSEQLDFFASHRVHPIDQWSTRSATAAPLFFFGFAPEVIALMLTVYTWHGLLLHANVRLELGPLNWIIATPRYHHWHHANHPEAWDKNFAGQLSLLDVLFGTMYLPGRERPEVYGIEDPVPAGYVDQLMYPVRGLWRPGNDDIEVSTGLEDR